MLFENISPFIRFARCLTINENSDFLPCIPYDHRFFYVLEGTGKININNEPVTLEKNGLVIIHSGIPYHLQSTNVKYIALNFDYTKSNIDLIKPIVPENYNVAKSITVLEDIIFEDTTELNSYFILERCRRIQNTLYQILDICSKSLPFFNVQAGALFISVLVQIFQKKADDNAPSDDFEINQIIQYIQEQYATPIDNKSIAKLFNYHPNYISSKFKKYTGKPLHNYILDYRIVKAINIMNEGVQDLKVISSQVGFQDYNYFSRYFTKTIGVSPKKYIKQL